MLKQTTQSTVVVSTAEAKAHMHVDHSFDDTEIDAYVRAAQSMVEERTRRSFAGAVFVETSASRCTVLGRIPITTVDSVKINTTAGEPFSTTLVVTDDYRLDLTTGEAVLVLETAVTFAEVEITWTAGSTGDLNMRDSLRHAVLLLAAAWYEAREGIVIGTISGPLPLGVDALCQMYASTN